MNKWLSANKRFKRDFLYEKGKLLSVNFDVKTAVSYFSGDTETIIISDKESLVENSENYGLIFVRDGDKIFQLFSIKTEESHDGQKKISYYNTENQVVFTQKLNQSGYFFESNPVKSNNSLTSKCDDQSIADATQECIADAYSNHGWVSVWATVQSAFIPQTVAAIAVACALEAVTSEYCEKYTVVS